MNRYKYKAINSDGKNVKGQLSADNPIELETLLKESNLFLVSYSKERSNLFKLKLSNKELVVMFSHLSQLDKAGVSIIDSIIDIKNSSESNNIKNLMQEIYESLRTGSMFSESLTKHPKIFSPVFVGLIATGEKTGNLHDAFSSIVEDLKWSLAMRRKTIKATVYPLFSLFIMCVVLGVMTTVVVPKVTDFLSSQDINMPASTKALMAFSKFVQNHWIGILVTIPSLVIFYFALGLTSFAIKIDKFKLRIPVLGSIINKIESSKFCHFFSITFKSGLGVLECLEACKQIISNRAIKSSIEIAKQKVNDGESLSKAIASTGYFPSLVVRMFDIGESTGNMDEALKNVRFFYDQEINDSIDRMVGMIQPTLTLIMGGMMAWITIAVFGPIYSSFNKF